MINQHSEKCGLQKYHTKRKWFITSEEKWTKKPKEWEIQHIFGHSNSSGGGAKKMTKWAKCPKIQKKKTKKVSNGYQKWFKVPMLKKNQSQKNSLEGSDIGNKKDNFLSKHDAWLHPPNKVDVFLMFLWNMFLILVDTEQHQTTKLRFGAIRTAPHEAFHQCMSSRVVTIWTIPRIRDKC